MKSQVNMTWNNAPHHHTSLTHSNTNVKHEVVMCVSIYTSKCNIQHLNIDFNKLKLQSG